MITFYSVVKGFDDPHIATIQRNAACALLWSYPEAQVIWFGEDEPGALEAANLYGIPLYPMKRNEYGAPLLPSVIEKAHEVARFDIRCLVNADILLPQNFGQAVETIAEEFASFLFISRRVGVAVDWRIDFSPTWFVDIAALDRKKYTPSAIDFFCYRGGWLRNVPQFGIGRSAWDNWIVGTAKQAKIPIVDGTQFVKAFHQEHEKQRRPKQMARNRALFKAEIKGSGDLTEATHRLTKDGNVEKGKVHK